MSVTAPAGFRAAGIAAGIKVNGAADVAVVVNDGPLTNAAAVFTTNRVKAAPVQWSQKVITDGQLRAIVLNSGGANACTGTQGYVDTMATAQQASKQLDCDPQQVAVCSTGLIGQPLPMSNVLSGVDNAIAGLTQTGGITAAQAIMTTDTRPKIATVVSNNYRIGGIAKGAGMLAPSLATMLVVLTTDAVVSSATLDSSLRKAVGQTFERLDSDGCMSTNDTVLLLASGASGVKPDVGDFTQDLIEICADLSRQLLADAEGSTKDVAITVSSAASEAEALEVARAIARNSLLKCALFGNDPNWGRVLAAVGTTQAVFEPDALDVSINRVEVCRGGAATVDRSTVDLTGRDITIEVQLHAGNATATIWTNDLSIAYVHENSAHSS